MATNLLNSFYRYSAIVVSLGALIWPWLSVVLQNSHCMLDVGLAAVQRLQRHQIYPIVLLVKFKSAKQVREVKDSRFLMEKVSAKAAKEMYDHACKLEAEYRHLISGKLLELSTLIDPSQ